MNTVGQARFLLAKVTRSVPNTLLFGKRCSHNLWYPDAEFMREFKVILFKMKFEKRLMNIRRTSWFLSA